MFKTTGLQVRRDGTSHAQYLDHWLNVHAPMSQGVAALRGYVANEVVCAGPATALDVAFPAFGAPVDGIAQLHFDTADGLRTMAQDPAVERWFSDGPNYVGQRTGFIVEEQVIVSPGAGDARRPFKAFCFLTGDDAAITGALGSLGEASASGLVRSRVEEVTGSTNLPGFEVPEVGWIVELWAGDMAAALTMARTLGSVLAGGATMAGAMIAREIVIQQPPQAVR